MNSHIHDLSRRRQFGWRWAVNSALVVGIWLGSGMSTVWPGVARAGQEPPAADTESRHDPLAGETAAIGDPDDRDDWRPIETIPGWDESLWDEFREERRWPSQHPMLLNLLNRLPNISWENRQQYLEATGSIDWHDVEWDSQRWLGHFFELRGRVQQVRRFQLPPEIREYYLFDEYLIAEVTAESGQTHLVACRQLPKVWARADGGLDEPMRAAAMLLKVLPNERQRLFVADRLEWYPDRENPQLGVEQEHVWLARQGVDLGQLEQVSPHSVVPILPEETELAMRLVQAASEPFPRSDLVPRPVDLVAWLTDDPSSLGRIYEVTGKVRRVTEVQVESAGLQQRFGFDRYYQLDLVVSAPAVRLEDEQGRPIVERDDRPFVYGSGYPVTVLCRQLPPELQIPLGQRVTEPKISVTVPAFYLKNWRHRSVRTRDVSDELFQRTPLLIGFAPRVDAVEERSTLLMGAGVIALVAIIVLLIAIGWRSARKERPHRPAREQPETIDFDFD